MFLKELISKKKSEYNILKLRSKFRKENKHNNVSIISGNSIKNIKVGNYSYGMINFHDHFDGSELIIGSFCSIAAGNYFSIGGEHYYNRISTFPFQAIFEGQHASFSKGNIIIGDDVWIGVNCTFLSGVKVGTGAVIGAGSVVVKDIPPYSIAAGNPCKVIKYRFENDVIDKLLEIDFCKINKDTYAKFSEFLNTELDANRLNQFVEKYQKGTI